MDKGKWKGESRLSWQDIETCVKILVDKIKKTGFEFDCIATVSRGGLVPARLVADNFNIKKIIVDAKKVPKAALFVDDIYDSGDTFKRISKSLQNKKIVYATLVARKGVSYPDQLVFAIKTKGKEYVVFPWDKLEFARSHTSKIK